MSRALAHFLAEHELLDDAGGPHARRAARNAGVRQAGAGLRGRVLARQVRADQRHLLRRHRPARAAGHARAHDDVPGGAALRRRPAARAGAAADRHPAAAARRWPNCAPSPRPGSGCAWTRAIADGLAEALTLVTQTRRVSTVQAAALGFWSDSQPEDNPPRLADGSVEVPAWRHALINYPHPLLQRGLVVIDTPGLNAIGAEPELTLGLLPAAHAIVFVLAADTGVTRSDLAIWREHLGERRAGALRRAQQDRHPGRPAVDAGRGRGADRRAAPQHRADAGRCRWSASSRCRRATRWPRASPAMPQALQRSRLPALEEALAQQLLPRQRELLARATAATLATLRHAASRRLGDRRRHNAEQMLELRGLRGKSGAKVKALLLRLDAEMADFERCSSRLSALRAVHQRQLQKALGALSSDALRAEVAAMRTADGGHAAAPGRAQGLRRAVRAAARGAGRGARPGRRDPADARRQLPAAQRRVRLRLHAGQRAAAGALRRRAGPDRAQLRPLPRPGAGLAPGQPRLHGAVPAHAAVQAARGLRERRRRGRAVEQGRVGADRAAAARAPPRLHAPPRGAAAHPVGLGRTGAAHRRGRAAGQAPGRRCSGGWIRWSSRCWPARRPRPAQPRPSPPSCLRSSAH